MEVSLQGLQAINQCNSLSNDSITVVAVVVRGVVEEGFPFFSGIAELPLPPDAAVVFAVVEVGFFLAFCAIFARSCSAFGRGRERGTRLNDVQCQSASCDIR